MPCSYHAILPRTNILRPAVPSNRHGLSFQPFQGEGTLFEESLRLGVDIRVGFVQPVLLSPRQETLVDQFAAVRDHGDVLKAKIWFISELMLRLNLLHQDDVLNPDAEVSVFVVSRLIRYHVPWRKGDFRELDSGANADRPLMHVKIRTYTMASAVSVV